jgi:hypothetical protein
LGKRSGGRVAPDEENPHEAGLSVVVDDDVGDARPHVDHGLGPRHALFPAGNGADGPSDRERGNVHAGGVDARPPRGRDQPLHHVGGRGDDEDAHHALAAFGGVLLQHLIVELRLLHGHGDVIRHLEAEGLPELFGLEIGQVDLAHDHALAGDTHHGPLRTKPTPLPQLCDGVRDHLGLPDLAVDHCTGGQRHLGEPLQLQSSPGGGDARGADGGGADVEPGDRARAQCGGANAQGHGYSSVACTVWPDRYRSTSLRRMR